MGTDLETEAAVTRDLKYFGRILPPKCEFHACYETDDGVRFYCTNMACNLHKYRRSKHSRYARHEHLDPRKAEERSRQRGTEVVDVVRARVESKVVHTGIWPLVHFKCPSCSSMDINMRILENRYTCNGCGFQWK